MVFQTLSAYLSFSRSVSQSVEIISRSPMGSKEEVIVAQPNCAQPDLHQLYFSYLH